MLIPNPGLEIRDSLTDRHCMHGGKTWYLPPRLQVFLRDSDVHETGLSQVHNLYFVASHSTIHVYEPEFPTQRLSKESSLFLDPPASGSNGRGTLDPHNPHGINNMLVDFLGYEEILLVCCDDGDVIGYFTGQIQSAIERRQLPDCPETREGDDVKPFFIANVEQSAWGLAIHTQSRKIAVSANTHRATVFAFALAKADSDTSSSESIESVEEDAVSIDAFDGTENQMEGKGKDKPHLSRNRDHRIELKGMHNNLPCVSFCNTGEDPEGRFLITGDITGIRWTWDLHELRAIEFARLEYCSASIPEPTQNCPCDLRGRRFPHSIWGLYWLDRRIFRSFPEGEFKCTPKTPRGERNDIIDISDQREAVPDSSEIFRPTQPFTNITSTQQSPDDLDEGETEAAEEALAELVVELIEEDADNEDDEMEDEDDEVPTISVSDGQNQLTVAVDSMFYNYWGQHKSESRFYSRESKH
jgi:CRT10